MCLGESPEQSKANECREADYVALNSLIKASLSSTREYSSLTTPFQYKKTDTPSDRTSCSILEWDRAHPEDKSKWVLQQPALIDIEPPYVYTVVSRNESCVITSKRCMLILPASPLLCSAKETEPGSKLPS
jgi:hypothetical protein